MKGNIYFSGLRQDRKMIWECPNSALPAVISRFRFSGGRLLSLIGIPDYDGEVKLEYCFDVNGHVCIVTVKSQLNTVYSSASVFAHISFFEKEISRVLSVTFIPTENIS